MKTNLREDLALETKAKLSGWESHRHVTDKEVPNKTPYFPLSFSRILTPYPNYLKRSIWKVENKWICAENDGCYYLNHRHYKTLAEALEKES